MAGKGAVDSHGICKITIQLKKSCNNAEERVATIKRICQQLLDDESLKGGDGETIRSMLEQLSKATGGLADSMRNLAQKADVILSKALEAQAGRTTAAAEDQVSQAVRKVGIAKE